MTGPGLIRIFTPRRRRRAAGTVLALSLLAAGSGAGAQGPLVEPHEAWPDPYTARVAVEDRGDLDRALAGAMRAMLVRLTGLRHPERSPGVDEAFAEPERFVQQYVFESGTDRRLTVKFDEGAVDGLVEQLGLGRWSRVRPRVIVWLAVEDERGRKRYVDSASPLAGAIEAPASERGLPFLLPLLDIEDRMTLPVSTLWGGFPEPIERASRRYPADAVLAGRAHPGGAGYWTARWTLFADLTREFRTDGESLEVAVAEGVHQVADRFAARFAMRGAAAAAFPVEVSVDGVEGLEDYARLLRYFSSVDIVEKIHVARVEPARVHFVLQAKGGRPALAELISLGRTLVPVEEDAAQATGAAGTSAAGRGAAGYRLR